MGFDTRKHVFGAFEKQRHRPACVCVQSVIRFLGSNISRLATSEISFFKLVSVVE